MANAPRHEDGWDAWGKHVLIRLTELRQDISGIRRDLAAVRVEVYTLKGRSLAWGAMGGAIVAVGAAVLAAVVTAMATAAP